MAEQLAVKKYKTAVLEDMKHEKRAIDFYLRHHGSSKVEELMNNIEPYQKLLSSFFRIQSQKLLDWMKSPFNTNRKYLEGKIYKTGSGNVVRSKLEALIDMVLYTHKIPFRYECELQLEQCIVYPDFAIRHPVTEEVYYWEHFGKMDDPQYAKRAGEKLQLYISNGIIPTINLITTYETLKKPLNTEELEKIVGAYFV